MMEPEPSDGLVNVLRWMFVAIVVAGIALAVSSAFSGCAGSQQPLCRSYYRFDGTVYYRVDECDGQPPKVICTSPVKPPTETCR